MDDTFGWGLVVTWWFVCLFLGFVGGVWVCLCWVVCFDCVFVALLVVASGLIGLVDCGISCWVWLVYGLLSALVSAGGVGWGWLLLL